MIAFGPVPSRRLGNSLGINNIPPKHCSYSCIYCQVGRTKQMTISPMQFYMPDKILEIVQSKISENQNNSQPIDYLTLVADGEPTLDIHLSEIINKLKTTGIPVAIITNASLINLSSVQDALKLADWVSVKVDSVIEQTWRKIDRPHGHLDLTTIQKGILDFSQIYQGTLVTETMLVRNINDDEHHFRLLADFLSQVQPSTAYLAAPIRPPAESSVKPPLSESLHIAYQILSQKLPQVEFIIGHESGSFQAGQDIEEHILSITAVHPMREEAIFNMLNEAGHSHKILEDLVNAGKLSRSQYEGSLFYLRNLSQGINENP